MPGPKQVPFWDWVQRTDTCWVWTGAGSRKGYGQYRKAQAHRVAYELTKGPIPEGLVIDHLCRNTSCVRPSHLEAVTPAENDRRQRAAKTHCTNGHPYTPENTYIRKDARGGRECITCRRSNVRRHRERRAAS